VWRGQAYAAYSGFSFAACWFELWLIERSAPTRADLVGAALAISGVVIIIGFGERLREDCHCPTPKTVRPEPTAAQSFD
jgi:drug/metabolite transporter superfamily protein YnfA